MDNIIKYWKLPKKIKVDILNKSTWNIGDQYVLKYNSNPDKISRGIRVAELLKAEGIPVVQYVKTIDREWTTPDGTYCLMKRIKGEHIDLFESDVALELGREIARLHIALTNIDCKLSGKDNDFLAQWQNDIKPRLINVPDEMIAKIENLLFKFYKDLPRQQIHRDLHLQNILFDKGKIAGWIDFDLSCQEVRIFDLAYLLTGLLCGKIDNPAKVKMWKIIFKNIVTGYNEISPLTNDERKALPVMMIAIELLFVTFWSQKGNVDACNSAAELAQFIYNEMLCD